MRHLKTNGGCNNLKMREIRVPATCKKLRQFNVQFLKPFSFLNKSSFYKIFEPGKGFAFLIPVSSMVFL